MLNVDRPPRPIYVQYCKPICIYIYIYIYPFYRAIYRSDNLLQSYPLGELLISIYFQRRGLYRCIEPSNFRNIYEIARSCGHFHIYFRNIYENDRNCGHFHIYFGDLRGIRTVTGKKFPSAEKNWRKKCLPNQAPFTRITIIYQN